jgi:hypothetical protein
MLIHCTKRACERLKITPLVAEKEYNPLYSWRLNVVEDGRKRLVVFMNDASRYCVVLDGIKAKDWAKLPQIFAGRLREVLLAEQINPDIIDRYLAEAGSAAYFKNADSRMTAWINKACELACRGYSIRDTDVEISLFANHYHVGTKNEKDCYEPTERFYTLLSEYGLPLKRCRAFEFMVDLKARNGFIRRNIIVPATITFEELCKVIKKAYGWWRPENQYHFLLYTDKGVPALYLKEERDPSSYDLPAIVLNGVRLDGYLPKYKQFEFLYDYKAGWRLFVRLMAEYDNHVGDIPCLVMGEGSAPPEDVGSEDGFAEFLDKLNNGKYKERYETSQWGKSYGYAEFDFEKVNKAVVRSLIW